MSVFRALLWSERDATERKLGCMLITWPELTALTNKQPKRFSCSKHIQGGLDSCLSQLSSKSDSGIWAPFIVCRAQGVGEGVTDLGDHLPSLSQAGQ